MYGLELGRSVRRTEAGAYRAASRTACLLSISLAAMDMMRSVTCFLGELLAAFKRAGDIGRVERAGFIYQMFSDVLSRYRMHMLTFFIDQHSLLRKKLYINRRTKHGIRTQNALTQSKWL